LFFKVHIVYYVSKVKFSGLLLFSLLLMLFNKPEIKLTATKSLWLGMGMPQLMVNSEPKYD